MIFEVDITYKICYNKIESNEKSKRGAKMSENNINLGQEQELLQSQIEQLFELSLRTRKIKVSPKRCEHLISYSKMTEILDKAWDINSTVFSRFTKQMFLYRTQEYFDLLSKHIGGEKVLAKDLTRYCGDAKREMLREIRKEIEWRYERIEQIEKGEVSK